MPAIIDHFDDPTGVVLTEILTEKIAQGGVEAIPDFVKGASLIAGSAYRQDKTAFAWGAGGRLPCDTPLDTWLSAMYFEKTSHNVPHQYHQRIREKLAQAAELHDVDLATAMAKVAAAEATPDVYALEATFAADDPLVKRAGRSAQFNGDGTATIRLYPVTDREKVAMSAMRYPLGLVGDLAELRGQLANALMSKCAEFSVNPNAILVDDVRPIKRSAIIAQMQYRIGLLKERIGTQAKHASLYKTAASRGVTLPYDQPDIKNSEPELVAAYDMLFKQAFENTMGDEFWNNVADLDKLAGFDERQDVLPAASMREREVVDDRQRKTALCANNMVNIAEVMAKVGSSDWENLAPHVIPDMSDSTKLAKHIEALPAQTQAIILARVRGW